MSVKKMDNTLGKCKIRCKERGIEMATKTTNSNFSLSNPPLICVVARMQFTPIPKIKDYVINLQDELRQQGFLHFEERLTHAIHIDQKAEVGTNVSFKEVKQWVIADQKRNVSIRLDDSSISILFGDYTSFSDALPFYENLLQAIEKNIVGITYNQLQLRYINHINLSEGMAPDQWVQPSVLGLPNLPDLQRSASVSETSYQTTSGGHLVVRCSAMPSGITMPPDLLPLEIKTRHPLQSSTPFILLENLHAIKLPDERFTAETCLKQFKEMRADIHKAFKQTTTQNAQESWK